MGTGGISWASGTALLLRAVICSRIPELDNEKFVAAVTVGIIPMAVVGILIVDLVVIRIYGPHF